jgi:Tol biopolymer transport system component
MDPRTEFEEEVRAAMAVSDPSPAFLAQLRQRVSSPIERASRPAPAARLAWAGLVASLVFLLVVVWVVGPRTVYAEFRSLFAFLPGVGVVQNDASLKVLAEPVESVRDGITVKVIEGAADAQHTTLVFQVDDIPQSTRPGSEDAPFCSKPPSLRVGSVTLEMNGGEGNGWGTGYQSRAIFPALPAVVLQAGVLQAGATEATLVIPCLMDTRPGSAPENWEIGLRFLPAPPDMKAFPVYELASPSPERATAAPKATLPVAASPAGTSQVGTTIVEATTAEATTAETSPTATSAVLTHEAIVNGTRISLDQVVETEKGFIFKGSIAKDPNSVLSVYLGPGTQLLDVRGTVIPTEGYTGLGGMNLQDLTAPWGLETVSKAYPGPWRLHIPAVVFELSGKTAVSFDLGADPQVGQTWELNQTVEMGGHALTAKSMTLTRGLDQTLWLEFTFQGGPEVLQISSTGDLENHSARVGYKGGSAESGAITFGMSYDQLPTGKHQLDLYGITVIQAGPWELGWQPPAETALLPTPTALPQACLTEARWQGLRGKPGALPEGLKGQLLVEENTGQLMPQMWSVDLATGQKQAIALGGWSSLSPDGSQVAYIESNGPDIRVAGTNGEPPHSLAGSKETDYGPVWSPDGKWIAVNRANEGVYALRVDGSGSKRLTPSSKQVSLAGWTGDSRAVLVSVMGPGGSQLESIDLATGAAQTWMTIANNKGGFGRSSPDGSRILFNEAIFGKVFQGAWASNLDGSGRTLLASLDTAAPDATAWSPDGQWVAVTVSEFTQDTSVDTVVLVQLQTCRVVVTGLQGRVTGWR